MDKTKIYFICDRKRCGEDHNCMYCVLTSNPDHAATFQLDDFGNYVQNYGNWIFDRDGYFYELQPDGTRIKTDKRYNEERMD